MIPDNMLSNDSANQLNSKNNLLNSLGNDYFLNHHNNNTSYHDNLEQTHQNNNLSFTNLLNNAASFEIEDHLNMHPLHSLPLSPQHRSFNYQPQSVLSKPIEEDKQQQEWSYNWQNTSNNNNNEQQFQSQQQLHQSQKDGFWENNFMEGAIPSPQNDLERMVMMLPRSNSQNYHNFQHRQNSIQTFNIGFGEEYPSEDIFAKRKESLKIAQDNSFLNSNNNSFAMHDENIMNTSRNSGINHHLNNSFNINTPRVFGNESDLGKNLNNQTPLPNESIMGEYNNEDNQHMMDIEGRIDAEEDHRNQDNILHPMFHGNSKIVMNYYDTFQQQSIKNNHRGYNDAEPETYEPSNTLSGQIDLGEFDKTPCFCNCKKSKCLKLYCECFARLGYCGEGCHCHECYNRKGQHQTERIQAIQDAQNRNPEAFQNLKINSHTTALTIDNSVNRQSSQQYPHAKRGCNCRKTKCLKKYCECFNSGGFCGVNCKCEGCLNRGGSNILQDHNRRGSDNGNSSLSSLAIIQGYEPIGDMIYCQDVPSIVQNYQQGQNIRSTRRNECFQELEDSEEISSSVGSVVSEQKRKQFVVPGGVRSSMVVNSLHDKEFVNGNNNNTSNGQDKGILEEQQVKKGDESIESVNEKQNYLEELEKKLLQISQIEQLLQEKQQLQQNYLSTQIEDEQNATKNHEAEATQEGQEWLSKKASIQHQIAEQNMKYTQSQDTEIKKKKKKKLNTKKLLLSDEKTPNPNPLRSLRILDNNSNSSGNRHDQQQVQHEPGSPSSLSSASQSYSQKNFYIRNRSILSNNKFMQEENLRLDQLQSRNLIESDSYYPQITSAQASAHLFEPSTYTKGLRSTKS